MKEIIAVASGKGGVGKSTFAVNLAAALAKTKREDGTPRKVALIDVDFYGPSIPTLMGGGEIKVDHEEKFIPASKYGVKYISIAFFLKNDDDPVIWRGPMFGKAISQLFEDTSWGECDICVVDMPPGTGDAQLSLSQMVKLSGAIMITTPQEVALSDVRRAINMFGKVNVPLLGVVENMSGYITPNGEKVDIFGSGGGEELAKRYDLDLLGQIPIDLAIREGGDKGEPVVLDETAEAAGVFTEIAERVLGRIEEARKVEPQVKIVN